MKAIEILKMIDNVSMRLDAIKIIEHFQNEAYNQALEDAAKNVTIYSNGGVDFSHLLNKNSILNLKK